MLDVNGIPRLPVSLASAVRVAHIGEITSLRKGSSDEETVGVVRVREERR